MERMKRKRHRWHVVLEDKDNVYPKFTTMNYVPNAATCVLPHPSSIYLIGS